MTSEARGAGRIIGSLRSADGKGVVRLEDRFDTGVDDVWAAITDPARLASWYGEITGDLRIGGQYQAHVFATGWEGTGRVEACEPPRRLVVTGKDPDEPFEDVTEVTLTPDGDHTVLVFEQRGMPLDYLAGYGAGNQIHIEDLAAYLGGHDRCDSQARFAELFPAYQDLAANIG
jgi:uncharacterized protein YndB with AHSA1/START domain